MRHFAKNISWLAAGKIFQILMSATIGVLVARYLGPSEFGRINYTLAFVGIFAVIVPLGLPSVLVRQIVRDRKESSRILAIALGLQGFAAAVVYALMLAAVFAVSPNDNTMLGLTSLYGLTILASPGNVYRSWFEAEVRMGRVVKVEMIVLALTGLGNLTAILSSAPMWVFLLVQTLAVSANSIGAILIYARERGSAPRPIWEWKTARTLLRDSWPLIISAVGLILYLKIDQVMLGRMASESEVGVYAAALKLSEIWYSVPMILVSTFYPAIVRAHEVDPTQFEARVSALLDFFNGISISIALVVSLTATSLVSVLYGSAYDGAGPVLALHVWASVFIFMGTLTGKWYLLAGIQKLNILRNFLGAGINVALNLWAIPIWGAWGAALATLISYGVANYLSDALSARARPLFILKTRSMLLWPRLLWRPKQHLVKLRSAGPT